MFEANHQIIYVLPDYFKNFILVFFINFVMISSKGADHA
jgi:hypothetical protein